MPLEAPHFARSADAVVRPRQSRIVRHPHTARLHEERQRRLEVRRRNQIRMLPARLCNDRAHFRRRSRKFLRPRKLRALVSRIHPGVLRQHVARAHLLLNHAFSPPNCCYTSILMPPLAPVKQQTRSFEQLVNSPHIWQKNRFFCRMQRNKPTKRGYQCRKRASKP